MPLRVPAGECESEYVVKKSRFIARLLPVGSREDVNAAVARARADHPDARHHCWAYLFGRPEDATSAGMSDDGEPAGTAGRPILNALQHGGLGDALVIVIRYFGGIKLGAGGLVRAYGTAARQVLESAPAQERRAMCVFQATGDYAAEQPLRHFLAGIDGQLCAVTYGDRVQYALAVPEDAQASLADYCAAHGLALAAARCAGSPAVV